MLTIGTFWSIIVITNISREAEKTGSMTPSNLTKPIGFRKGANSCGDIRKICILSFRNYAFRIRFLKRFYYITKLKGLFLYYGKKTIYF